MNIENLVVSIIVLVCLLYILRPVARRLFKKPPPEAGCRQCSGCGPRSSGKSCH